MGTIPMLAMHLANQPGLEPQNPVFWILIVAAILVLFGHGLMRKPIGCLMFIVGFLILIITVIVMINST